MSFNLKSGRAVRGCEALGVEKKQQQWRHTAVGRRIRKGMIVQHPWTKWQWKRNAILKRSTEESPKFES